MITLLLLVSSGLQAFHLAHIPILSRPPLPLDFPYFLPSQFYLLQQQRSDDILHEFRHIVHFPSAARNDRLLQVIRPGAQVLAASPARATAATFGNA